jgi:hypothetical protein
MAMLIAFIVLEIFNLVMGTVILSGKMDNFIRNSFELTPKDAGKFDIRRLRILMGAAFLALIPVFCLLLLIEKTTWAGHALTASTFLLVIVYYILVYTWAKK